MHILSVLIFAICSSSDNIVVGLSYGAKKVKVTLLDNIGISFISAMGTFLSMMFGRVILRLVPIRYANFIGSTILLLFGLYLLFNSLKKENTQDKSEFQYYEEALRNPELIDTNNSKTIEFKEAVMLGLVLCLNNVGLGIGASITGMNICLTSIASLFFSFVFIPFGYYIGEKVLPDRLSSCAETISAAMIIALAIYEFFI